jgi:hypothetical protein
MRSNQKVYYFGTSTYTNLGHLPSCKKRLMINGFHLVYCKRKKIVRLGIPIQGVRSHQRGVNRFLGCEKSVEIELGCWHSDMGFVECWRMKGFVGGMNQKVWCCEGMEEVCIAVVDEEEGCGLWVGVVVYTAQEKVGLLERVRLVK